MHSENLRYTPRVNRNVKNGLWVIVFINHNCYITVGRMSIVGEAVHVWNRGVWDLSLLPSEFCCEFKTPL